MQQHAEPVDGAVAALRARRQQWRLDRDIDDVGDERRLRQLVEVEVERRIADHALAGGVDQHRGASEHCRSFLPRAHSIGPPKSRVSGLGALLGAVDQPDLARAVLDQAVDHSARAATGAHHHDRTGIGLQFGICSQHIPE